MKWHQQVRGGTDVKLTIGKAGVVYDFSESKREFMTGVKGRTRIAAWPLSRGTVTLAATLTGDEEGTLALHGTTARGNATGRAVPALPRLHTYGEYSIVANLRAGHGESLAPLKSSFACSASELVLTMKQVSGNKDGWGKLSQTLTYHRV